MACINGKVKTLLYSDFCLGKFNQCSGSCGLGQYQIGKSCKTCATIKGALQQSVQAIVAGKQSCTKDAECTTIAKPHDCVLACKLPVRVDAAVAVANAVTATTKKWCPPSLTALDPCGLYGSCKKGVARCVKGQCALVAL